MYSSYYSKESTLYEKYFIFHDFPNELVKEERINLLFTAVEMDSEILSN